MWRQSPSTVGDAKIAGTAHEVTDPPAVASVAAALSAAAAPEEQTDPGSFELIRLDLTEAVVVRIGSGQLLIETWHPGRGVRQVQR